ncbi:MAG: response regulator [Myxococcota bacterium]
MDVPVTSHSEPATLCLKLDVDQIPGDRVAALVDAVAQTVGNDVELVSYRSTPVRLHLAGPQDALERLKAATVMHETLRSVLGSCRSEMNLVAGAHAEARRRLVLLVDADPSRARTYAEFLDRAEIDVCVVSRGVAAQSLLQRTALPFDAVVLHHRLTDCEGLELLSRLEPDKRRCAVLAIDEQVRSEVAHHYRVLGAFRYISPPEGPLQLIGRVHATINETQAWRGLDTPSQGEEPPRQFLDPQQAANRLRFVCKLSSLERDVAHMLLMGERDLTIAKHLGKSERTAKRHVGRVLEKAGIQNRSSLWAVLYKDGCPDASGSVSPSDPSSSSGGGDDSTTPPSGPPAGPTPGTEPGIAAVGCSGSPVLPGRPAAPPTTLPQPVRW